MKEKTARRILRKYQWSLYKMQAIGKWAVSKKIRKQIELATKTLLS